MSLPVIITLVVILVVLVIAMTVFMFYILHKKKVIESERKADEVIKTSAAQVSDKFGGKDNIKEITNKGSRVTVLVEDMTKVDKKAITDTLEQVMFMNNKVVFIIGSKSEDFKKLLEENVDKTAS